MRVDITDAAAVEKEAARSAETLGSIDILVCSAGVAGFNAPLWDYPIEEWRKVFDVNVNGLFHCNRYVVPYMQAKNYGRIVNIASIAGKEGNPNATTALRRPPSSGSPARQGTCKDQHHGERRHPAAGAERRSSTR